MIKSDEDIWLCEECDREINEEMYRDNFGLCNKCYEQEVKESDF